MITYKYAKGIDGEYVDIKNIDVDYRASHRFFCISCDQEMVASLGEKNTHHFRHKRDTDCCSKETYLHKLGKYTFKKAYRECLEKNKPYTITLYRTVQCSLTSTCKIKHIFEEYQCVDFCKETVDLTKYYKIIEEEKRIDSFVPDLILKSDNNRESIFIEIKVTHACSEDKIHLGHPIIEITIKEESDISIIESCSLIDETKHYLDDRQYFSNRINADKKISFYNFKYLKNKLLELNSISMFFVKKNGLTCFAKEDAIKCNEIERTLNQKNKAFIYRIIFYDTTDGIKCYLFGLAKAYKKGIDIRNCYLCKYYSNNKYRYQPDNDKPIKCMYYTKPYEYYLCNSNKAVDCSMYEPDESVYKRYLSYAYHYEEI